MIFHPGADDSAARAGNRVKLCDVLLAHAGTR